MSNTKYLELDSTYRNRLQYPRPTEFTVEMAQGGQGTRLTAKDPVCNSAPIMSWVSSFAEKALTNCMTGIWAAPNTQPMLFGSCTFQICSTGTNAFRQIKNYYVGACLSITNSTATPPFTVSRRITAYEPFNDNNAQVTLESSFPDAYLGSTASTGYFFIQNPTPLPTNSADTKNHFFIPTGMFIDNFYNNYLIGMINTNTSPPTEEYRKIVAYEGNTRLAELESPTTVDWLTTSVSGNGYAFVLRKEIPANIGNLVTVPSSTSMTLSPSASSEPDFYVGNFIRIITPVPTTDYSTFVSPFGEQRLIKTYNSVTKAITIDHPINGLQVGDGYEIESFSRDNCVPFSYNGSIVSSQEAVCYSVELLNLVIPNFTLKSGRGGRPVFYPTMYLEFQAVSSATSGYKNIIYSNNPNSTRMLYRVLMSDIPAPLSSTFIKVDGDSMTHVIKFRPNDSFKIALYHANGEPVEYVMQDNPPPAEPNPLVQISACFAFKKL